MHTRRGPADMRSAPICDLVTALLCGDVFHGGPGGYVLTYAAGASVYNMYLTAHADLALP